MMIVVTIAVTVTTANATVPTAVHLSGHKGAESARFTPGSLLLRSSEGGSGKTGLRGMSDLATKVPDWSMATNHAAAPPAPGGRGSAEPGAGSASWRQRKRRLDLNMVLIRQRSAEARSRAACLPRQLR